MSDPSAVLPPRYDDLPELEGIGVRHSWEHLPPSAGTLSFLSAEAVLEAAHAIRTGEVVTLSLPSDELDPPLFGRQTLEHDLRETARNTFEDVLGEFNPQAASQWDGLLHIRAREFGFFGGITDPQDARREVGIHHWAQRGIVGRGVLADVASALGDQWDPMAGDVIEPDLLVSILAADGVELQRGDVLCVRTGWLSRYREGVARGLDPSERDQRFSGLAAHDAMVRLLWDAGVAAVVSDNPAVESAPGDRANGSLHRKLIPGLGFALGELADLDVLAVRCRDRAHHTFLFAAAPMPLVGGASSTLNALALL